MSVFDHSDWRDRAACKRHPDPENWSQVGRTLTDANRDAIQTCRGCDVRPDCTRFALTFDSRGVIYGGYTDAERVSHKATGLPVELWPAPTFGYPNRPCARCATPVTPTGPSVQFCPGCRGDIAAEVAQRRSVHSRGREPIEIGA